MSEERSSSFDPGTVARRHMLSMAQSLRREGQIYSAVHLLKRLLGEYPETAESRLAVLEYASLGEFFESQGMVHTALSMYEWLRQLG